MNTSRIPSCLLPICLLLSANIACSAQNFGSVAIGSSTTATITVSISTAGTVGTIGVVTQGAPNLDFTEATGGTCAAKTYASGATCTVNVTFTPKSAGARYGAVSLYGASGDVIANAYLHGTGVGPLAVFAKTTSGEYVPGKQSILSSAAEGVAVDASGNLFVTGWADGTVKEFLAVNGSIPASPTIRTLGSGFVGPNGMAVDGSGNVFVADRGADAVKEILAAGGYTTVKTLGGGFGFGGPNGVAVDANGNVFVADWNNAAVYEILAAGGYTTVKNLGGGFSAGDGVAVDGDGNVFATDFDYGTVKEILAAGGYTTVKTLASGLDGPAFIAVDANGNVFVTIYAGKLIEILAGSEYATVKTLASGLSIPSGVAVDQSGNVFVADSGHGRLMELNYADPPSLAFAKTTVGAESGDSPQTVTLTNTGNATLTFSAIGYPFDFPEATGDTNACTDSTSLSAGQTCDITINFLPQTVGALSEDVTLTDNALNLSESTQNIAVSGTGLPGLEVQTISFATLPNVVLGAAPLTLRATATSGLAVSFAVTGPATLSGSTLTLTGCGLVSVTASQSGDATYAAAPPVTRTFTVFLTPTVKVLTSTLTATLGWPVTLTATVSGTGATPTGIVTFYAGSASLGPANLSAGIASLTTSAIPLGSQKIAAKYSGDATYTTATSAAITQVITNIPTLTLAVSPNPVNVYSTITLTATVENPTGSPLPTNQVKFYADFQPIGLATLTNGVATLQTSTLSVGQHYISVEYLGDTTYKYIPAVVQRVWVGRIPVTLAVTSSTSPATLGSPVTFTAILAGTLTSKSPTGNINFYNGNVLLGTGTLSGNSATFTTTTLPHGVSTITAQFWGDANYLSTNSPNFTQYVW